MASSSSLHCPTTVTSSSYSASSSLPSSHIRIGAGVEAKANVSFTSSPFLNDVQRRRMEEAASRCGEVVCQIRTPDPSNRGTGFLIGGALLLTNHHVLRDSETAKNSYACFFQVVSENLDKKETHVKIVKVPLKPDVFWATSPHRIVRRTVQPATDGYLDFTVVALDTDHPYLSSVQHAVISIFEDSSLNQDGPVCVIQCPEEFNPDTLLTGDLKWSYGQITKINPYSLEYNAPTRGGSSGGAVINREGKLVALHHQALEGANVRVGVLVSQIAAALESRKTEIMTLISTPLAAASEPGSSVRRIICLPYPTEGFVGRREELAELDRMFSTEMFVAISGLGGVGKTTLANGYARTYFDQYQHIYSIRGDTQGQLDIGLLNLAEELNIPQGNIRDRFMMLKRKLETSGETFLLIFEGVDSDRDLNYLGQYLPQRGGIKVLLTSRLNESLSRMDKPNVDNYNKPNFKILTLASFSEFDALNFLLKAVEGKDTDEAGAAALAKDLGYFPLALDQAAAFICSTEGYTFRRYSETFARKGVDFLGEEFVLPGEKTIFATWNTSIEAILATPKGRLAQEILNFFSMFAEAPIPSEIITFMKLPDVESEDLEMALRLLKNYSLIQKSSMSYFLHPLMQKIIRHRLREPTLDDLTKLLDLFTEIWRGVDFKDYQQRKRLDLYLPHFELLISYFKSQINKNNISQFYLISDVMWIYYFQNGDNLNAYRIAAIQLEVAQVQRVAAVTRAECLDRVGISLRAGGEYREALSHQEQALSIRSKLKGGKPLFLAASYNNLSLTLMSLGRYDEAFTSQQQALEILVNAVGEKHAQVATILSNMGCAKRFKEHYEEAIEYHKRALEMRRDILGENHLDTAISYENLGVVEALEWENKLINDKVHVFDSSTALDYQKKSLEIREKILGVEHVEIASNYCSMALIFTALGNSDGALRYCQLAFDIRTRFLGPDHPATLTIHGYLSKVYEKMGNTKERDRHWFLMQGHAEKYYSFDSHVVFDCDFIVDMCHNIPIESPSIPEKVHSHSLWELAKTRIGGFFRYVQN